MIVEANLVFLLHKAIDIELAYKLKSSEFKCKCDRHTCNNILFHPSLKDSWNLSRMHFGKPMKVNSGYRCESHNHDVGGKVGSKHTQGKAVDISSDEFNPLERQNLKMILEKHFDRVIEYPTFFHCQND